jgi:hypothetical protein
MGRFEADREQDREDKDVIREDLRGEREAIGSIEEDIQNEKVSRLGLKVVECPDGEGRGEGLCSTQRHAKLGGE